MEKELIINSNKKDIQLALVENKRLVELHNQPLKNNLIVGDIYLGRVSKLLPGLNAAFIDIGFPKKDAFLRYYSQNRKGDDALFQRTSFILLGPY